MPSFRCKIKKLRFQGILTENETERILDALDKAEKTAEWIVEEDIHCSKCGKQIACFVPNPNDAIALILDNKYCPVCGAKMQEVEE